MVPHACRKWKRDWVAWMWDTNVSPVLPRLPVPRSSLLCSQDLLAYRQRSTNYQRSSELHSQGRLWANWNPDRSRRVEAHAEEWTCGERNAWGRGQGNSRGPRRMPRRTGWGIEEKCRRNETKVWKGLGRWRRGKARAERISRAVFISTLKFNQVEETVVKSYRIHFLSFFLFALLVR